MLLYVCWDLICVGIQAAVLAGLAFNGSIQSNFPVREYTTRNLIDNFIFHSFLEVGMILTFLSMVSLLLIPSHPVPSRPVYRHAPVAVVSASRTRQS